MKKRNNWKCGKCDGANITEHSRHCVSCAFQYHDGRKIVVDTKLITRVEAEILFEKYLPEFLRSQSNGAEIALWEDMKDEFDYHKSRIHLNAHDKVSVGFGKVTVEVVTNEVVYRYAQTQPEAEQVSSEKDLKSESKGG